MAPNTIQNLMSNPYVQNHFGQLTASKGVEGTKAILGTREVTTANASVGFGESKPPVAQDWSNAETLLAEVPTITGKEYSCPSFDCIG